MKAARVYLKPEGNTYHEFGLPDDATMATVRYGIGNEGGMMGEAVYIPADVIHHIVLYTPEQPLATLTVFPGGKVS